MEVKAKLRFFRGSPRKIRLILNLIRGMRVRSAEAQLKFMNKKSAEAILKLLKSGEANAVNNFKLKKENLYIKSFVADQGPTLKRWRPRAMGRATPIRKRSVHLTLVLDEYGKKDQSKNI